MKSRCSRNIHKENFAYVKQKYKEFGLNYEEFQKELTFAVNENAYKSYQNYMEKIVKYLYTVKGLGLQDCDNFGSILDNCYILLTSKYFVIDLNKIDDIRAANYSIDFDLLEALGDVYVDFRYDAMYMPLCFKICKADYSLSTKARKNMKVYNVSLLSFYEPESKIVCLYTCAFSDDLSSRFLVENLSINNMAVCVNCSCCNIIDTELQMNDGIQCDIPFCLVGQNKIFSKNCLLLNQTISIIEIQAILGYILTMFSNRPVLHKKNKYSEQYKKNTVSVVVTSEIDNEYVMDFSQFYRYEQGRKDWQGGHHNSPAEHYRKAHKRVLRNADGSIRKVVNVKSSIVNKRKKE